jgi:hypothetical protein
MPNVLTAEQIEQFHKDGYLVVDFGLDHQFLDTIIDKINPLLGAEYHNNPSAPARVQDAWKRVDEVRVLATRPNILNALEQLFGRKPLPFQTLNFPVGTRQSPHSDTIHFNTKPSGFMAGVWVALQDITMDNGPLIYYPGSHTLPEYSMEDFGLGSSESFYKEYEVRIRQLVEERGLQPAFGVIKKGEALIWHANLLHGGSEQRDLTQSRHSQVTHYFFSGCRYYTPMLSKSGHVHYRDPEWIPVANRPHSPPGFFRRGFGRLRKAWWRLTD